MKNLNFKNFNYSIIDSVKEGYKEVLVTYVADEKPVRKILFIKEAKGKNSAYYISEAKKQIESQINSGALTKSASKQIKHAGSKGILKPVMVTLSCVLAAGAIGTGGYFTYRYFTTPGGGDVPPGPGPEPTTTGHTVVLVSGEGSFADNKTYLIFNNVEDGTALGDIQGYVLPEYQPYTFEKWSDGVTSTPYGTSYKVTGDLVLTASFIQGVNYYRAEARNTIMAEYNYLVEEYELPEQLQGILKVVTDSSQETLDEIEESSDPAVIDDAMNTIKSLTESAVNALSEISVVGVVLDIETAQAMAKVYQTSVKEVAKETNSIKRYALTKMNDAYIKALPFSSVDPTQTIDVAFDYYKTRINNVSLDTPEGILEARLLPYYADAAVLGASYLKDSASTEKVIKATDENLKNFMSKVLGELKTDDTDTINWIGNILRDVEYAKTKWSVLDPGSGSNDTYDYFINDSQDGEAVYFIDLLTDYLVGESQYRYTPMQISIESAIMKALADARVTEIGEGKFPTFTYFNDVVISTVWDKVWPVIQQLGDLSSSDEEFALANKLTNCLTNLLEAFGTWQGEWSEIVNEQMCGFEYLFSYNDGSDNYDSVIIQATDILTGKKPSNAVSTESALLDVYLTLSEKAVSLAKKNAYVLDGNYSYTYYDIYDLGNMTAMQAEDIGGGLPSPASFYKSLIPVFNSAIDSGVSSGYHFDYSLMGSVISSYVEAAKRAAQFKFSTIFDSWYIGSINATTEIYTQIDKKDAESIKAIDEYLQESVTAVNNFIQSKFVVMLVKMAPAVLTSYGETLANLYGKTALDIFSFCISKKCKAIEAIAIVQKNVKFFSEKAESILNQFKPGQYPDANFLAYFDTMTLLSSTIPNFPDTKLIDRLFQFVEEGVVSYFVNRLDKAEKLKEAINDNFVKLVNPKMTEVEFNAAMESTNAACKKIIEEK